MRRPRFATLALLALGLAGWGRPAGAETPATYPLRGILRHFDRATGQASVTHDAIPGYMPAMTMDFSVADPAEMERLRAGDAFTCRLRVAPDHAWLESIHQEASSAADHLTPAAPPVAAELRPGDPLPDVELIDEHGQPIRLSGFRGQALALTFIYLRCPLPNYCPLMNRNFQSARDLVNRLGLRERIHFLSVTMDPANDTPARLAEYASALEADEHDWTFACASEASLHVLGDAVGLEFRRDSGAISHNLRTVVVKPDGTIRRVFRGNTWTPPELAAELRAAAAHVQ